MNCFSEDLNKKNIETSLWKSQIIEHLAMTFEEMQARFFLAKQIKGIRKKEQMLFRNELNTGLI